MENEQKSECDIELAALTYNFNFSFSKWAEKFNVGANFGFEYDKEGRKTLIVLDTAPLAKDMPASVEDTRVKTAEQILSELSSEDGHRVDIAGTAVTIPEADNAGTAPEKD